MEGLFVKRNAIAHGYQVGYLDAPPGRRYVLVPLYGKASSKKRFTGKTLPTDGALCVKDIDLIARQYALIWPQLQGLYDRLREGQGYYAEYVPLEPQPQTAAQLRRQITQCVRDRQNHRLSNLYLSAGLSRILYHISPA